MSCRDLCSGAANRGSWPQLPNLGPDIVFQFFRAIPTGSMHEGIHIYAHYILHQGASEEQFEVGCNFYAVGRTERAFW